MAQISEADWKVFKQIKERALEKYCLQCLAEFKTIAERTDLSPHERYLLNYKTVTERDNTLANIFNGLSRSRAVVQLLLIRRECLADQELTEQLSELLQTQTHPKNF
ncbi:hypothetical protein [Undibacterium sp.]|uniref:hypothetical protein n=1 Tax=Undibacterium sp. TaxID=1914977 RepID=UPI00375210DB